MTFDRWIQIWDQLTHSLSVMAWPTVVFVVMLIFRKQIADLIRDIKNIIVKTPGGGEVNLARQKVQANNEADDIEEKDALDEIKEKSEGKDDAQLKAELKEAREQTEFEKIYREIFGSQINLLDNLVTFYVKKSGVFYLFFQNHFEAAKKLNPPLSAWSTEEYLNYLFANELIEETRKEPSIYNLTEKGFNFVHYLNWKGYVKNKGL